MNKLFYWLMTRFADSESEKGAATMKLTTSVLIFLLASLLTGAFPVAAAGAYPQTITTTNPFVNLPRPSDDPRWQEAFSHWDNRDQDEEVQAAVRIFEQLARDYPDRSESHLWLARSYYLTGMRLRGEDQVAMMKKAAASAARVLEIDPENLYAMYWRMCALSFYHDLSEEDLNIVKKVRAAFKGIRELPVPTDDPLWAAAIAHWDARMQREEALQAIEVFKELEKKHPRRIEPKLWLLRSHFWMAYLETAEEDKARWCMLAYEWGQKAIKIEPRNPMANYLTAVSIGMYCSYTSTSAAVYYSYGNYKRLMVVLEEEPTCYYCGTSAFLAASIPRNSAVLSKMLELVGFHQELVIRMASFAVVFAPDCLMNHYALGEMYIFLGQRDKGKASLKRAINSDPTILKNMEPENRMAQEMARKLLDETKATKDD